MKVSRYLAFKKLETYTFQLYRSLNKVALFQPGPLHFIFALEHVQ